MKRFQGKFSPFHLVCLIYIYFILFTCTKITKTKSVIKMNKNYIDINYIDYILNKQNLKKIQKHKKIINTLTNIKMKTDIKIKPNSKY